MELATIGRSFIAVAGGFAAMALLVTVATLVLRSAAPNFVRDDHGPQPAYMMVNLAYSAFAALLGGYVAAALAAKNPLIHSLVLALVVLLLSALSALQLRGKQPVLYQIALTALTPIAVLCGGLYRMHELGLL